MLHQDQVLVYSPAPRYQSTVRRHYLKWRATQGIPRRCDNPRCRFHIRPLCWNKKALPLILDHKFGNPNDNTPQNLRLLCPNCDSQLDTRGGRNRNRVESFVKAYHIRNRDGTQDAQVFGEVMAVGATLITGTAASERHQ